MNNAPDMTETKTDALLEILLALLIPILSTTDPALARRAAQQAIDEYRADTHGELVTIAQIVGFAVTALDTLRLSMAAELSNSMKLKLRGNANALSKVSHHATRALEKARQAADWTDTPEPEPIPTEPVPTTLPPQEQNRRHWANAMTTVAAELQAKAAHVPAAQRQSDQLWVDVLTNVATGLRQPGARKAELFRTTLLASNPDFPAHLINRGTTLAVM
jgi:hypothetical protein